MHTSYDQSVGNLTNVTSKKIIHHLNVMLEKFNVTSEQWLVLLKLSIENNISQKTLAKLTNKDQPTLTRILDILERKGLVERKPSKEDRRSFVIHITEAGLNLKDKIEPFLEDVFKAILAGISSEALNTYINVLLKINDNISKINLKNSK